ncbi:MAG TPA: FUSC family protein [Mycobacterium sp.]|nr:FUSC family protein [Mycobacterium sp.]
MRAPSLVFARAPGARPAVVGGLINGVAIGVPLLLGAAVGGPAMGATACLGAYLAAFTNKGGERWRRTAGLVVTALINTAAFAAGAVTNGLFPVDVALFATIVFIAGMGAAFGGIAVRCGTMPATAFLTGVFASQDNLMTAVGLVAAGGLWYAVATMVLTPTPRLHSFLTTIGAAYRAVAVVLADEIAGGRPDRSAVATALRHADEAVLVLAGPGGDDAAAQASRALVDTATALLDSTSRLRSADDEEPSVAAEYRALGEAVRLRLEAVADELAGSRGPTTPLEDEALERFVDACNRVRHAAVGETDYARVSAVGHLKRQMLAITDAADRARAEATDLVRRRHVRLQGGGSPKARVDSRSLRGAMRLDSTTFRHALRTAAITSVLFAAVTLAHLDHGEWAALAALRVLRPQYRATTQRAWQRVIGNVVGGTCAAVAIAWIQNPTVLAGLVFVVVAVGFALRPVNYAFWVIFGTPLILLIGDLADPGDWHAAVGRIAMTILGTATAVIGYVLFLPDWDRGRLAGQLARATSATADYVDAVVTHVADPTVESRTRLDAARRAATSAVRSATETLAYARREPGQRQIDSAATVVDRLTAIVERSAALASLPDTRSSPIPQIAEYRRHAVAAARGVDAAANVAGLSTAADQMRRYVLDLHQQREVEIREQPDGETALRAAIRENEPVIDELIRIAELIGLLSHGVAARSHV